MTTSNNPRRQFLLNTALVTVSAGILPNLLKANENVQSPGPITCDPTTLDYYGIGPFYKAGAPVIADGTLAAENEPGTRLILSGIVKTLDCLLVIADAAIDIWHANDAGQYDNAGFNLRGITYSNPQGFYVFETILPGKYLNGSKYRPRHIHVKITPPGYPSIVTQLYFQGDTDIPGDAAASITSGTYNATSRIIPITLNGQGEYEGTWDIIVNGGTTGVGGLHLEKGILYSVSPNPFTDTVEINYGIYQQGKVNIQVFDIRGSLVATLGEKELNPEKYTATWKPDTGLPVGVYWVTLKINDLQVHYLKILKV